MTKTPNNGNVICDITNNDTSHPSEVNKISVSQKEDIQKDNCCGQLMINHDIVNSNEVYTNSNMEEESTMSTNVTYNMLSVKVRRLCESIQVIQVHS